jgi:hypothetical protein
MKITPLAFTAFEITEVRGLDPVRVILQDYGTGQGRLILECYGKAWANFWASMGGSLIEFLRRADAGYIETALHCGQKPRKSDREYLLRIVNALKAALADAENETSPSVGATEKAK